MAWSDGARTYPMKHLGERVLIFCVLHWCSSLAMSRLFIVFMPLPFVLFQEDDIVTELVKVHGARKWSLIASHLRGRIGKQCRERYGKHVTDTQKDMKHKLVLILSWLDFILFVVILTRAFVNVSNTVGGDEYIHLQQHLYNSLNQDGRCVDCKKEVERIWSCASTFMLGTCLMLLTGGITILTQM